MKFADILASSIHDMKNSLWMVINTLESLEDEPQASRIPVPRDRLRTLQQEAKRLSSNLIELLTLYKLENGRVSLDVEELSLDDFLEELVLENSAAATAQGIELSWVCDPGLNGYFDEALIRGVINSLIGNGLRYSRSKLLVSARQQNDRLVLSVEDDGEGFPPEMLESADVSKDSTGLVEGRTRLGIHFARMVAEMHDNRGVRGGIHIANGSGLGGGNFSITLP